MISVPDTYNEWAIHQGPDDLFYASLSAETWEGLREMLDHLPATPSQRLDAATVERCARVCEEGLQLAHDGYDLTGSAGWNGSLRAAAYRIRALATEPHQHGGKGA